MFEGAYFGYNGSPRALAVLLLHNELLLVIGSGLFTWEFSLVIVVTFGLVLLYVPMNLMQMWDEMRDPGEAPERKRAIFKTFVIEIILLLPAVGLLGFSLNNVPRFRL